MKALTVERPGVSKIVDAPVPEYGPRDVLIRVRATGVCGTDVHIFRGEYLGDYPITPGHESAGVVEAVGEEVSDLAPGDAVAFEPNIACGTCRACLSNRQNFCLRWQGIGVTRPGSMAELVVAPESNVFAVGDLDPEIACFMEPLSCVLHGIQKANIRPADRVLILGAGPIGILLLECSRILGVSHATVLERVSARRELAAESGADETAADFPELPADAFDVVIDATGAIPVLERAIEFVRYGGTMLFFGVAPSGESMRIEPFKIFEKGLTIVSSYTSLRNSLQAVALLSSGVLSVSRLISHRLPLERFEEAIRLIESGEDDVRKVVLIPDG